MWGEVDVFSFFENAVNDNYFVNRKKKKKKKKKKPDLRKTHKNQEKDGETIRRMAER